MPCPGMRNRWPCGVPGGTLSTTRFPSRVRTLIFEPSSAWARLTGTTPMTSSPSRRKNRSGSTWMATTTSPRPLAPCPLRRSRVPSSVPAGMVIAIRLWPRTSPGPAGRAPRPTATPGSRERPVAAQLVVLLPFVGIAQHVVRFVDLLEAVRRLRLVGVTVGMVLLGESAKRLLDLVRGRRLGHAESLIIILLAGHL